MKAANHKLISIYFISMKPQNWTTNSQLALFDALKEIKALLRNQGNSKQLELKKKSTRPKTLLHGKEKMGNGIRKTAINEKYGNNPIATLTNSESINTPSLFSSMNASTVTNRSNSKDERVSTALNTLCKAFGLSKFERQTLLLVVGAEIMPGFPPSIRKIKGSSEQGYPTFNLAFKLFASEENFHYFSFSDNAPLLDWELVKFKSSEDGRCFKSIGVDAKILDYLLGYSIIDKRLEKYISFLSLDRFFTSNTKSFEDISLGITRAVETSIAAEEPLPLIQLSGSSINLKRQILATTLKSLEFSVCELPLALMPSREEELERLCFLWNREAALEDIILLLNCEDVGKEDSVKLNLLARFLKIIDAPVIISTSERLSLGDRLEIYWEIPKLTNPEQHQLWQMSLGEHADKIPRQIDSMVANFQLTPLEIDRAVRTSLITVDSYEQLCDKLWATCRERARPKLDELAKRIEPSAGWSDLILPDDRKEMLREMIAQVRHRTTVLERWGFGNKKNRGLGLCALFAGTSGTGKTMAAEVIASELKLDLYRIDLSTVVSKYIGETEKNLKKLFDAAESGGVILLFDEGDALFGKRTEANDSKDKYANMEVSYLLQRIETYSGLAIITTNIEDSLDSAFMRRLRYVVKFPFPGAEQRAQIWKKVYPTGVLKDPTPRIYEMLGQMEISGGLIYSIALKSAFIAADRGADGVYLAHIEQAARSEYTKIGRTLSISETPWVHHRNY